jgi:hypothetical protein
MNAQRKRHYIAAVGSSAAHSVGRAKDRSRAILGGNSPFAPALINLRDFNELSQGLLPARAEALAARLQDAHRCRSQQ